MNNGGRILAVCGLVSTCGHVVRCGVSLARSYRADLFVMHAIYDPFGIKGWNLPLPSLAEDYRKLVEKTKKDLHEVVSREKQRGMVIRELVREGKPVDEILKVIDEEKIDLLLLPAHQETRLERLFSGRENRELIRKMPCSILLVKQEPGPVADEETPEPGGAGLSGVKKGAGPSALRSAVFWVAVSRRIV